METIFPFDSVSLSADNLSIIIIDQTQLPNSEVFLKIRSADALYDAIKKLKVRGAPAIGVAAALGLAVFSNQIEESDPDVFKERVRSVSNYLRSSRPTAVNLMYALDKMNSVLDLNTDVISLKNTLLDVAISIKNRDVEMCYSISQEGLKLLRKDTKILTHCNAGHLAVSRYGTALGPIHLAQQRGLSPRVFVDETRPLLQGARLTAYELMRAGVDTVLICDNMAASLMSQGQIDIVFVGADRIAANGDVANKIGTCSVAVLANHYGVPVYVLAPSSTIDMDTPTGRDIEIEQRDPYEITEMWYEKPMAPIGIKVYNPAFDVTPASLITGIVTEKGLFRPEEVRNA